MRSIVMWLIRRMSVAQQKAVLLEMMDDLVKSKTGSIDDQTAELIMQKAIKSTGNKITAFIVKD